MYQYAVSHTEYNHMTKQEIRSQLVECLRRYPGTGQIAPFLPPIVEVVTMNYDVTVAAPHLVLRAGPVQQGDVLEVTEQAAVVVVEKLVEMSVLLRVFVGMAILHFHMDDVSPVQNN